MKVLIYKNENNEYTCPKCWEKIKINKDKIDDIYYLLIIYKIQ